MLRFPSAAYVAPFVVFVVLLGLRGYWPFGPAIEYPLRTVLTLATLLADLRGSASVQNIQPWSSIALGVVVFVIWVGPDVVWPHYREHWLFRNSLWETQRNAASGRASVRAFLFVFRVLGSCLLVPVIEELFWRGWLMRWLIRKDFLSEPLGSYAPSAFWITAILFASNTARTGTWDWRPDCSTTGG